MPARAMWKGRLKLGSLSVPVKLYSAVQDRDIHFNILEARTEERIEQEYVHPETGEEVSREEIRMGYEVERGVFVVLEKEELDKLEPEASRDIELTRFVPPSQISHQWYERPYYLGPDGNEKQYFALAEALEREKREGIARWVMRKKRYVGALRSDGGYLLLVTLRFADEILSARDLPRPSGRDVTAKELKMAEQLVSMLDDEFRPGDFRDEYRDRVLEYIEAKASGKKPKLKPVKEKREPKSLIESLEASVNTAKREREKEVA